jgi:xanthine/uracil permease
MGRLELGRVSAAPWLGWPLPFPAGPPKISAAGLTAAILAYFVVLANLKGSLAGIQEVVGGGRIKARTRWGAAISGWAGVLAGAAGGYGPVAYALSPGVILSTGVGTRWAIVSAGGMLLVLGFCSKVASALAVVPGPVVAAAMIASMAAQIGAGLSILTKGGRELTGRDFFVIGLPLLLGTLSSILPREFIALLPPLIGPLAGNGLVVGLLSLVLLERVILKK